jgi:hypothetical protein
MCQSGVPVGDGRCDGEGWTGTPIGTVHRHTFWLPLGVRHHPLSKQPDGTLTLEARGAILVIISHQSKQPAATETHSTIQENPQPL